MSAALHAEHDPTDLCAAGTALYERSLREGGISAAEAEAAPCLLRFGLLEPTVTDLDRLEPVATTVALQRLFHASAERIADERRLETRIAEAFEPLLALGGPDTEPADAVGIRLLSGLDRINDAISEAMANVSGEILTIQPRNIGDLTVRDVSIPRDQALLDRGGRIRTLYQHTQRHVPTIVARYEQLHGDVEARTLDQVTERLLLIDRQVAFIPASKDRSAALEIRQPTLLDFLAIVFDRLWHLATPMHPQAARRPSVSGVTARQRAIAHLLIEGHTDGDIADRLGMNVRTARLHIAKLAATLGSQSRAQLGYLIGRSGILDREA